MDISFLYTYKGTMYPVEDADTAGERPLDWKAVPNLLDLVCRYLVKDSRSVERALTYVPPDLCYNLMAAALADPTRDRTVDLLISRWPSPILKLSKFAPPLFDDLGALYNDRYLAEHMRQGVRYTTCLAHTFVECLKKRAPTRLRILDLSGYPAAEVIVNYIASHVLLVYNEVRQREIISMYNEVTGRLPQIQRQNYVVENTLPENMEFVIVVDAFLFSNDTHMELCRALKTSRVSVTPTPPAANPTPSSTSSSSGPGSASSNTSSTAGSASTSSAGASGGASGFNIADLVSARPGIDAETLIKRTVNVRGAQGSNPAPGPSSTPSTPPSTPQRTPTTAAPMLNSTSSIPGTPFPVPLRLRLSKLDMSCFGVARISVLLEQVDADFIKGLCLQYNSIGEEGLLILCPALQRLTSLTALDISCNNIALDRQGSSSIFNQTLQCLPQLSRLDLSNNRTKNWLRTLLPEGGRENSNGGGIDDGNARQNNADGGQDRAKIEFLRLSGCGLSAGDLQYLQNSEHRKELRHLDLSENTLSGGQRLQTLYGLLTALSGQLTVLELENCKFEERELVELLPKFRQMQALRFLNLSRNDKLDTQLIVDAMDVFAGMRNIEVLRCSFPAECYQAPEDEEDYSIEAYKLTLAHRLKHLLEVACEPHHRKPIKLVLTQSNFDHL